MIRAIHSVGISIVLYMSNSCRAKNTSGEPLNQMLTTSLDNCHALTASQKGLLGGHWTMRLMFLLTLIDAEALGVKYSYQCVQCRVDVTSSACRYLLHPSRISPYQEHSRRGILRRTRRRWRSVLPNTGLDPPCPDTCLPRTTAEQCNPPNGMKLLHADPKPTRP